MIESITIKYKEDKNFLVPLYIYGILFLFFCSKMSPLYPTNEWSDVNVYFNIGKGMFSGMTLYSEIFDHKGPLIFFIYGLGSLFSKSSFIGLFLFQIIGWLVALTAIFYTAKLYLKDIFAFIISLLLPLSFLTYMHTGGSAEEMILLFYIISTYFFISYFKENNQKHPSRHMLIHGLLTSLAMLIKLNLILFWFFPLLIIFVQLLIRKEYKNFLQNCFAYIIGVAIIFVPVLFYFIYNDALGEAYHVYIELNKQYSSTNDYHWLLTNGVNKLYKAYRAELVWYLIISIGIFYFPFKHLKGRWNQMAIVFSGIAVFAIIFFPLTYHFYYPLPLFAFVTLGLIAIFSFLEKQINVKESKKMIYLLATFMLLVAINKRDFFDLGTETLLRQSTPNSPQFVFKDRIKAEKDATLLNIAFGEGNALFTTTGLTPSVKYFLSPNIYYNMYPEIRDSQAKYIEEGKTTFIIDCTNGFNYDFFQTFEPLKVNYNLIDSVKSEDKANTYYLYKRKN